MWSVSALMPGAWCPMPPPNERPTFSPFWHRVRASTPRLRPHVQITRQRYRGRRWHVVHDPTSNQFYRLNPIAFDFVMTLDGRRTVDEAWKVSLSKFADDAPTQNEVIQLISQLYSANLLSVDTTPETEQLLTRGRERLKKRIAAQAIGVMYFKLKLFNPDRVLTVLEPLFRPFINVVGLIAWVVLVAYAAYAITDAGRWPEFFSGIDSFLSPSNWGLVLVAFVVTKLWHELGHGVICKRYGGQVPEFGVMLLVLIPSPFVDASACWAFPSKWRRMAVGAGGMLFEWVLASSAALIWLSAEQGSDLKQIAYNVMFTSSVSTVLFNANPLMRFDGYYMLADLLEVPNLAQRSNKMLMYFMQKYVYRLKNLTPPSSLPGEVAILYTYGVLSGLYRVFLFFSITLYILGKAFALGLLLAIWTAAAWFLIPAGKFVHWLASSPQHRDKRPRSIAISLAMIAGLLVLVGWIPMPDHRRGVGVIASTAQTGVFFKTDGFVVRCLKKMGDPVAKDEIIVEMDNPDLVQQRRSVLADLEEMRIQERLSLQQGEPAGSQIAQERIAVYLDQLAEVERRIEAMRVRSPQDGVIVTRDPEMVLGAFVKRGDPLCEIVDPESVRVEAILDQRQAGWLADLPTETYSVEMRTIADVGTVLPGTNVRFPGAGQRILPSRALGLEGGGKVETEKEDKSGRVSRRPVFTVFIDPESTPDLLKSSLPGTRVHVRFTLEDRPWLQQWWERLEREIQGRVKL